MDAVQKKLSDLAVAVRSLAPEDRSEQQVLTARTADMLIGIVATLEMMADLPDFEDWPEMQNQLAEWSGEIGAAWLSHK